MLWDLVKDDTEFMRFIPDGLRGKVKRLPKVWFWRAIHAYDQEFANQYADAALAM